MRNYTILDEFSNDTKGFVRLSANVYRYKDNKKHPFIIKRETCRKFEESDLGKDFSLNHEMMLTLLSYKIKQS